MHKFSSGDLTNVASPQDFGSFPALDMNTADPDQGIPTELGQPVGIEGQLRCPFPECSEQGEFSTQSALRKHHDKHSKPYTCPVPGCKHPRFGDKGGLDRHKREVHGGSQSYCCPITSCKRNTKGFPRKYNLFEHQKRCHPGQPPNTSMLLTRTARSRTNSHRQGTEDAGYGDEETSSLGRLEYGDVVGNGGGGLQEKLERLRAQRAELDKDIEAVERIMTLVI